MPTFARSNTQATGGTGGTLGGIKAAGSRPGTKLMVGDEMYLWLLVLLEVGALAALRQKFRAHHGG